MSSTTIFGLCRVARRTVWVKPWILRRPLFGQYEQLLQEMNREDERGYRNFQDYSWSYSSGLKKKDTF